ERGGGGPPRLRADVCSGLRPECDGDFFRKAATRGHLVRGRLAVIPARSPRDVSAHRRSAGPLVHQAVPAGSDSLDFHMVRALLKSYEGTPRDAVFFFDNALAEKKYNNEIAAHYGLVASLLRAQNFQRAQ